MWTDDGWMLLFVAMAGRGATTEAKMETRLEYLSISGSIPVGSVDERGDGDCFTRISA